MMRQAILMGDKRMKNVKKLSEHMHIREKRHKCGLVYGD